MAMNQQQSNKQTIIETEYAELQNDRKKPQQ